MHENRQKLVKISLSNFVDLSYYNVMSSIIMSYDVLRSTFVFYFVFMLSCSFVLFCVWRVCHVVVVLFCFGFVDVFVGVSRVSVLFCLCLW